jgi:glycosyltransferase-like protein
MTSIGLFTYSTKPRGSVVHATYLAEALVDLGHDVTLYALSKAGDRLFRELRCSVVYLPAAPAPAEPDALIAQRIAEVAQAIPALAGRHDVYHGEDCLVASGLLQVRSALGSAPIVRTLHHLEHFESPYLQACQRRSILQADAVACVSRVSQRDVERELGRRCAIIGNGVDAAHFEVNEALRRETCQRRGIALGAPLVLSVGGVEPRKNSLRSLDAMSRVLRQQPTAVWVIAGGASIWEHDDYRAAFRAQVAALEPGVRARVLELGPVSEPELLGLYGACSLLLCCSLQEGFGLCVLEALAAGAAAVVSRGEPFSEYLPADAACFVDPESAPAIADGVARLLRDDQLRARSASAGRAVVRRLSWRRVALAHQRLYRKALAARVRSPIIVHEEPIHA